MPYVVQHPSAIFLAHRGRSDERWSLEMLVIKSNKRKKLSVLSRTSQIKLYTYPHAMLEDMDGEKFDPLVIDLDRVVVPVRTWGVPPPPLWGGLVECATIKTQK